MEMEIGREASVVVLGKKAEVIATLRTDTFSGVVAWVYDVKEPSLCFSRQQEVAVEILEWVFTCAHAHTHTYTQDHPEESWVGKN